MKIIELFDEVPIENILGAVSFVPEEIIYVGVIRKTVFESKFLTGIKQYLSYKKLSRIRIRYVQVKRNDINDAVDKLSKEIDGDALVDITGGYDTLLFAAGIAAADLNDAAFFRINPKNGNVTVSGKGVFFPNRRGSDNKASFSTHVIKNTVEENIALHGGEIADSGTKFEYTEDFVNDVEKLWRLCSRGVPGYMHKRSAPQTWNQFVFRSAGIEHMSREKQLEALKKYKVQRYLEELMRLGFISYRRKNDGTLSDFSYKNNQIRLCLSKAGDALEQKVYLTLKKYMSVSSPAAFIPSSSGDITNLPLLILMLPRLESFIRVGF